MAVRVNQFGREMDKDRKGKSLEQLVKRAAEISSTTRKTDKFQKPSLGDKIILALLRARKKASSKGGK